MIMMEFVPVLTMLVGVILGMVLCLWIVRWAFEYERKLILEFMDRDEATSTIQQILIPKNESSDVDTSAVIKLCDGKGKEVAE